MFPGNKPVRKMEMIVDDNALDIPAFRRRGEEGALRKERSWSRIRCSTATTS
jgi:hypothetical protein